jgi:hypothetical protein
MKTRLLALIASATILALANFPAAAQQKTVKQCNEEWTANKASIQASGKTKKAFVAECRGEATMGRAPGSNPTPAVGPKRSKTAAPAGTANLKTAKECNSEWTANKAAIQASKKTKKQFMAECRAQAAATPSTAPVTSPSTAAPASPSTAPSPPAATRAAPRPGTRSTAAAPTGAGQFSTEAQAKGRCPADTVVWVNLDSKVYHFAGTRNYGNTKNGAYMCEKDAAAAGDRAAKNEKHP